MWKVWPRLQVFADGRDYMYVNLYNELRATPFDEVLASRGVRTLLISHDDSVALALMHRSVGFVLVAFDDRAQLWTDRRALETRPGLLPLDLLRPEDLSLRGFGSLSPEELKRAEASAMLAVQRAPGHARPWAILGQVQRRRGELDDAVGSYEKAVALDPRQASYANNLGACFLDRGDVEEAVAQFRVARRFEPGMFGANLNLGKALLMSGDPGAATTALMRARELAPERAEPLYLLGRATPDPVLAAEYFKRFLEIEPNGPWADDARSRLESD
jgi:tetratricopeptide (TPR) repeat protein